MELAVRPVAEARSVARRLPATVVTIAVAAAACLPGLGRQPLSWDESVSVAAARRSLPQLGHLLAHTDAPLGLYYLGLHGWIWLVRAAGFGLTETWVRLPSALAAIAAVGLATRLGERIYGRGIALLAGILLSAWPVFEFYSRDARPYAATVLAVLSSTVLLFNASLDPRWWRVTLYAVTLATAIYLQLFAVLALLPQFGVVLRAEHRRKLLIAQAAAVASTLPLLWVSWPQSGEVGWIPPITGWRIAGFLVTVCGGAGIAGLLVLLAIAVRKNAGEHGFSGLLYGQAVLPPLLLIVGSLGVSVLVPRYALVAVPAIALITARAIAFLPRPRRLAFGSLVVIAGLTTSLIQRQSPYKYEDFRAITDHIEDHAHAGDTVRFDPASYRVGFSYYTGRDPLSVYPADNAASGEYRGDTIGGVPRQTPASDRIWLLTDGRRGAVPVSYHAIWSRHFGVVTLELLDRLPLRRTTALVVRGGPAAPG
jgi:mannosyltransferase